MKHRLFEREILAFKQHLTKLGYAKGTIDKYIRDMTGFMTWLGGAPIARESGILWRDYLLDVLKLKPVTVNSKLASLNLLFTFLGLESFRMKYLQIQRQLFRSPDRVLTLEEFHRLVAMAWDLGLVRLALILETLGCVGIRISELRYITVEALQAGQVQVMLKRKVRVILIPDFMRQKLLEYAKNRGITSGQIFITKTGRPISRRQVWAEMKALCEKAGVAPSKVFPHNIRHLFARTYHEKHHDLVRLADILGHSNMETTRRYLVSTGEKHARELETLGIVA